MDDPSMVILIPNKQYPIVLFKEPYKLLAVMLCRFYGVNNFQYFRLEWTPLAYYIETTCKVFNWKEIFSITFKDVILQAQKNLSTKKPSFYLSSYIMDVVCASLSFPAMNWHQTRGNPPIQIYFPILWEDNYRPHIYDIYDNFIGVVHFSIFKKNAPKISKNALSLIANMGDWYTT